MWGPFYLLTVFAITSVGGFSKRFVPLDDSDEHSLPEERSADPRTFNEQNSLFRPQVDSGSNPNLRPEPVASPAASLAPPTSGRPGAFAEPAGQRAQGASLKVQDVRVEAPQHLAVSPTAALPSKTGPRPKPLATWAPPLAPSTSDRAGGFAKTVVGSVSSTELSSHAASFRAEDLKMETPRHVAVSITRITTTPASANLPSGLPISTTGTNGTTAKALALRAAFTSNSPSAIEGTTSVRGLMPDTSNITAAESGITESTEHLKRRAAMGNSSSSAIGTAPMTSTIASATLVDAALLPLSARTTSIASTSGTRMTTAGASDSLTTPTTKSPESEPASTVATPLTSIRVNVGHPAPHPPVVMPTEPAVSVPSLHPQRPPPPPKTVPTEPTPLQPTEPAQPVVPTAPAVPSQQPTESPLPVVPTKTTVPARPAVPTEPLVPSQKPTVSPQPAIPEKPEVPPHPAVPPQVTDGYIRTIIEHDTDDFGPFVPHKAIEDLVFDQDDHLKQGSCGKCQRKLHYCVQKCFTQHSCEAEQMLSCPRISEPCFGPFKKEHDQCQVTADCEGVHHLCCLVGCSRKCVPGLLLPIGAHP